MLEKHITKKLMLLISVANYQKLENHKKTIAF